MHYTKKVSEPWFSLMKLGIKKCEGRLNKGDFSRMKKGDTITFLNEKRSFDCVITSIKEYKTFENYLQKEGLEKCLPSIDTIEEGVEVYHKYYSKEYEKKFGILAIRIRIKN